MTFGDYIWDKTYILLINVISMIIAIPYLYFTGTNKNVLFLLTIVWILMLISTLVVGYQKQYRYFNELHSIMEQLDKKYVFVECMSKQKDAVSQEYYSLL